MKAGKVVGIVVILLAVIGGVIGGIIVYQNISEKKLKKEVNDARFSMYNDYVEYHNQLSAIMQDKNTLEYSPEAEENYLYIIEKIEEYRISIAGAKWCNTRDTSFNNECNQFKDVTTDYLIKLKKAVSGNLDYIRGQDSNEDGEILLGKWRDSSDARDKLDIELGKIESRTDYYE